MLLFSPQLYVYRSFLVCFLSYCIVLLFSKNYIQEEKLKPHPQKVKLAYGNLVYTFYACFTHKTSKEAKVDRARLWIHISVLCQLYKKIILFGSNFGWITLKLYMKSTPILTVLNVNFRSAPFGKLRLSL